MSEYIPAIEKAGEYVVAAAFVIAAGYVFGKMIEDCIEGNVERAAEVKARAKITSSLIEKGSYDTKNKDDLKKLRGTVDFLLEENEDVLDNLDKKS